MKYIKNTKKVFKVTPILLSVSFWLLVASISLLLWGGNDLQAQEGQQAGQQARKTGWFIGVSPYFLGAEIKTTTEHTTLTEITTELTRTLDPTNAVLTASTTDRVERLYYVDSDPTFDYNDSQDATAISAVLNVCEDGVYDTDATGAFYAFSVDATSNELDKPYPAAILPQIVTDTILISTCYDHFQRLATSFIASLKGSSVDSSLSLLTTSENTPLTGNGLQLGYNFEKFRVSLNSHLWSGQENKQENKQASKLNSQLLLLDYFLPYGLYVGGGFGMAKLDTDIGSASKTAPALHFGYQLNFTNSFSLEAGLLWFGASFLLEKSAAAPEATISESVPIQAAPGPIVSYALVGGSTKEKAGDPIIFFGDNRIRMRTGESPRSHLTAEDRRILVKGTVTANYSNEIERSKPVETPLETKITKTTHEVEAPTSLFVRFVYIF